MSSEAEWAVTLLVVGVFILIMGLQGPRLLHWLYARQEKKFIDQEYEELCRER